MPIRIPEFTDLSDPGQARELTRVLRTIRDETTRTSMPVEQVRPREESSDENRLRVVVRTVGPSDPAYDEEYNREVHFFVGGKWMRVMLEDL
jgi:hypothetical protein